MGEEDQGRACGSATAAAAATDGKVVVPILDLLDQYWFFHNTLVSSRTASRILPRSPCSCPNRAKEDVGTTESSLPEHHWISISRKPSENYGRAARKLLRAPSMPAYRTRQEESGVGKSIQLQEAAMVKKSTSEGNDSRIVRHALVRVPSLPSYCDGHEDTTQRDARDRGSRSTRNSLKLQHCFSSCESYRHTHCSSGCTTPNPSISSRLRPPRDWKEEGTNNNYFGSQKHLFIEGNYRKSIQGKKWRSYSDLESFEVQAFKDLGFVFDDQGSNGSLVNVIPGLRDKRTNSEDYGEGRVSQPYLSEAWFAERSAPPKLEWGKKRSVADMKEKLRFWARAVACNVRQER